MAPFKPDILHPDVPPQPRILPSPAELSPFVGFQPDNAPDSCRTANLRFARFFENLNRNKQSIINQLSNKVVQRISQKKC
jgi:hypothetical protein